MSTAIEQGLSEATRAAFRSLAEKQRASFLKKVALTSPGTMREVLRKARIPRSFQPERIDRWITTDLQQRIEQAILTLENEAAFQSLLRGFFCQAHAVLNNRLLDLIDPKKDTALSFDEALELIQREFPQDTFMSLFVDATRWVCKDAIEAHSILLCQEGDAGADGDTQEQTEPNSHPSFPSFAVLDAALKAIAGATEALRELRATSIEEAQASLARAAQLVKEFTDNLGALAAEAGEPAPTWTTREEFSNAWNRLCEVAANRRSECEMARRFKTGVSHLLETVDVYHRLPRRKAELCELAKRAAAEVREGKADITFMVGSGTAEPGAWLEWAWAHEGTALESFQSTVQPISPSLSQLLGDVDWADLRWPVPGTEVSPAVPTEGHLIYQPLPPPHPTAGPSAEFIPPQLEVPKPDESVSGRTPPPEQPNTVSAEKTGAGLVQAREDLDMNPSAPVTPAVAETARPIPEDANAFGAKPAVPEVAARTQDNPPVEVTAEGASSVAQSSTVMIIWRLAREGRWGLASHLAAVEDTGSLPPPWIFQAAALGPRVNYEVSSVSQWLAEMFSGSNVHLEQLPAEVQRASRLILAGALLRPALLAPLTSAASWLSRLHLRDKMRLPHLDAVVSAIAEFSLRGQPLRPEMLQGSHNRDAWEREVQGVRAELREWLTRAPNYGFNYALAARIWRSWMGTGGSLRRLAEQTSQAEPQDVSRLRGSWKPWIGESSGLVQEAMRMINQRKTMDGTARDKLLANIREVVELAERLFALLVQSPERHFDFHQEQVQQMVSPIRTHLAGARNELQELASHGGWDSMEAAVSLCKSGVDDVARLIDGKLPLPGGSEPEPRWLIDGELLRDPSPRFDDSGKLCPPQASERENLLSLANSSPDWSTVWHQQIAAGNHAATAGLLELFRWQPPAGLDLAELVRNRERALDDCRSQVNQHADETRRLLDEFVSLGLCREKDYDDWSAQVESVRRESESCIRFAPLLTRLESLRDKLRQQREDAASRLRRRLDAAGHISSAERNRISGVLTTGDIHTAYEYLELAEQSRPLPEPAQTNLLFQAFFDEKGWLAKAQNAIRGAGFAELSKSIRDGSNWHGLDFNLLGTEQRERAVTQLQLWFNLELQRRADAEQVRELAVALGLRPTSIEARPLLSGAFSVQRFNVRTEIVSDRAQVLVPAFGSEAAGNYRLHLVWGDFDIDELVSSCRSESGDTAGQFVVCFRPMNTRDRRELADEARKRMFKAVVVDRALFVFLCAQPFTRLAALLRCGLPFARVEPYSVAAGAVPSEMFFGRTRELDSLADPRGSCFVYGGRQLGKTALLRSLERSFHRPAEGRAAIYLELKRELFSRGRPMDDLWNLLVTRLKEAGVLDDRVSAAAGHEALFKHIKNWLGTDSNRRLLVLLDEADSFLEEDGKETERREPFPRCQWLKGLMDDTQRRFKVVFAGLHNVQRSTRVSNHPLAHFGEAICVGPMLEAAESLAARELVEQPLAHAGYVFDSPDAVSRILAWTNYYPSLIQLFCFHLLGDLRENHITRFPDRQATPPCRITAQHVQAAYTGRVRQAIHEKVALTLDLDQRYKLIAYLLAFYHLAQSGIDGVDLREIRAEATSYWSAGFAEMRTDDEFRVLLEEMIGLGILRQVIGTGRYALRNPNVMMLLGTEEEITRQLDSAKDWEPVARYEADKFRRVLEEKPGLLLFSPLTAQQESELKTSENRVAVLCGLPAAGLEYVRAAIESLFGKARTVITRGVNNALALDEQIRNLDRPADTNTALIVQPDTGWDETWVAAASQRVTQLSSKSAFLTIVFVADARKAAEVTTGLGGARERGIRELTLRPWHDAAVRQWLLDLNLSVDRALRDAVLASTGYWPGLLSGLKTSSPAELKRSCEELGETIGNAEEITRFREMFALNDETSSSPLGIAAGPGQFSIDDLCEVADANEESTRREIIARFEWAERLGLVIVVGGGQYAFDPIAARLLKGSSAA